MKESEPIIKFDPQEVANWFAEIIKLPHGSGEEDPLRAAVYTWLTDPKYKISLLPENVFYDETAQKPGKRVIRAFRPGTQGKNPIVLQAHMDMVVVTEPKGVDPFPLQPFWDQEHRWLQARGNGGTNIRSTLGADDGIGIATALALLQDKELKDYPIECLFTVQEETDMGGAQFFDTSLLKGRTYINLDDELGGTITYGSAGGFQTTYEGAIARQTMSPAPSFVKIVLGGLRGGHSGVDIAKGRPSALKLLVEGLCRMDKRLNDFTLPPGAPPESYDFRLVSLARTDVIKSNAIPTEAAAVLAVMDADVTPLLESFKQWFTALQILYGAGEPNLKIELTPIAGAPPDKDPLTADATDNLLCFLRLLPQGVLRLIPGYSPAVVETSSNVYDMKLDSATMTVNTSSRTSNPVLLGSLEDHGHTPLNAMFRSLGKTYGLTTTVDNWYPAWPPNKDSHLLAKAEEIYGQVYPDPQISVIHAGLECGWIVSRYDDMDCIAIGPTIENPHTIDERLDTRSVKSFYKAVKALMLALFKEQTATQPVVGEKVGDEALVSVVG